MKKAVQVTEVENEGLIGLLNERILVYCMNYIYSGELEGVNTTCIKLKDAKIVYDTGSVSDNSFTTAEKIGDIYIQTNSIESFFRTEKK